MPTYLIDGHNLLYAARQGFLEQLVDGHPGSAAREELVRRLVAAFTTAGQAAYLYFDGSEAKTEMRSAHVQVIYPGGAGDQRADAAILKHVSRLVAPGDGGRGGDAMPIIVVTRDLKLARRARKRGADVMAPGEFLSLTALSVDIPTSQPAAT
jgi:predicted RNA-binding protein with PIN domain